MDTDHCMENLDLASVWFLHSRKKTILIFERITTEFCLFPLKAAFREKRLKYIELLPGC